MGVRKKDGRDRKGFGRRKGIETERERRKRQKVIRERDRKGIGRYRKGKGRKTVCLAVCLAVWLCLSVYQTVDTSVSV